MVHEAKLVAKYLPTPQRQLVFTQWTYETGLKNKNSAEENYYQA